MAQWDLWCLCNTRTQVPSPAWHVGEGILHWRSCAKGRSCSLDLISGPGTPQPRGSKKRRKRDHTDRIILPVTTPASCRRPILSFCSRCSRESDRPRLPGKEHRWASPRVELRSDAGLGDAGKAGQDQAHPSSAPPSSLCPPPPPAGLSLGPLGIPGWPRTVPPACSLSSDLFSPLFLPVSDFPRWAPHFWLVSAGFQGRAPPRWGFPSYLCPGDAHRSLP